LSRIGLLAGLLALCMAAGCKAQTPPGTQDLALRRHIEVMVRSQYSVPQDYDVTIGARKPSQIPGYDSLPITLTRETATSSIWRWERQTPFGWPVDPEV